MSAFRIPFNKPSFAGGEQAYIADAIAKGHISGDGSYTRRCHELIESSLGAQKVLLTTNCTHALEMSAFLVDIQPGDEVIVPSFAFVTTVNAFVLRGAKPVFVDVRADTLNIDETLVERAITKRTKAIVALHYAGVSCEMDTILSVGARHAVPVIEDNAHGLFGKYHGKWLGTLGCLATQSFHETKNITCGEGGALIVNDRRFNERAEILREKGTNRSRFLRGQVQKYTWVDLGSSYLPSDLLAAFLLAQLEAKDRIQSRRKGIWQRYSTELASWARSQGVGLPQVPAGCDPAWHLFYVILPDTSARERMIDHLAKRGILAVFHYLPLHLSDMGKARGGREGDCPVTERMAGQILRLPFYNSLSDGEQAQVIAAVTELKL